MLTIVFFSLAGWVQLQNGNYSPLHGMLPRSSKQTKEILGIAENKINKMLKQQDN